MHFCWNKFIYPSQKMTRICRHGHEKMKEIEKRFLSYQLIDKESPAFMLNKSPADCDTTGRFWFTVSKV